jgi:hypothetical protein
MGHFAATLFRRRVALSGKRTPAHCAFWPARTPGQVRPASRSEIRRIAHSDRRAFSGQCARECAANAGLGGWHLPLREDLPRRECHPVLSGVRRMMNGKAVNIAVFSCPPTGSSAPTQAGLTHRLDPRCFQCRSSVTFTAIPSRSHRESLNTRALLCSEDPHLHPHCCVRNLNKIEAAQASILCANLYESALF